MHIEMLWNYIWKAKTQWKSQKTRMVYPYDSQRIKHRKRTEVKMCCQFVNNGLALVRYTFLLFLIWHLEVGAGKVCWNMDVGERWAKRGTYWELAEAKRINTNKWMSITWVIVYFKCIITDQFSCKSLSF